LTWDYNANRKGHLYAAETYGPGESGSNYASLQQLNWDAAGAIYETIDSFSSAGYSNLLRETELTHTLNGSPRLATYLDSVGGTNHTSAQVHYDARGLPHHIQLTSGDGLDTGVATTTRNVAGLAIDQYTNITGSPITAIHSLWTYDGLGRVASQVVQTSPGPARVAEQDLSYFGNDDPNTLDHYLGESNHKQLQYLYDPRHQLLQANETTTPNYFSGQYTFGPAGRFTTATEKSLLPPNSDVTPRDVTYQYGTEDGVHDSEEVLALLNRSDGTPFATYDYDAVGNQTVRCLGSLEYETDTCSGESWRFLYDGKDRLRRASHFDSLGNLRGSEEYWYDPDGKRTQTVKRDNLGNKTEFVYWVGDVEAHYDDSGNVTHIYSYLSMGTTVARVDRTSNTSTSVEFLFHGLGDSTLAAVDKATGIVNASFSYAPFGEVLEAIDGAGSEGLASHNRRFNDKYEDNISGLTYYGARYYDKTSMTWTQADPSYRFAPDNASTQPRRADLYAFDLNNPLRYVDPDGLRPWWVSATGQFAGALYDNIAAQGQAVADLAHGDVSQAVRDATGPYVARNVAGVRQQMQAAQDFAENDDPERAEGSKALRGFATLFFTMMGFESTMPTGPEPPTGGGPGAVPTPQYVASPKHGLGGWGSPAPTDGPMALLGSETITWSSDGISLARMGYDENTKDIVIFRITNRGFGSHPSTYHGYVVGWDDLTGAQKAFMQKRFGFSSTGTAPSFAPADANHYGTVSPKEESDWMKRQR
jgi:RHS repeat-associated protein